MPVTTRIITFLVGNPELNLHLPLESWVGGRSKLYIYPVYVQISTKLTFVTRPKRTSITIFDGMEYPRLQLLKQQNLQCHEQLHQNILQKQNLAKILYNKKHTHQQRKDKNILLPPHPFPFLFPRNSLQLSPHAFMLPCTEAAEAEVTPEREAWKPGLNRPKKIGWGCTNGYIRVS